MSNLVKTPVKRKNQIRNINLPIRDDKNNKHQLSKQQSAKYFIVWYKSKIDNDRQHLSSYLSDDVTLEWFGRTIKTKKKVSSFVKNDIQNSRHDFTTVESVDRIESRSEKFQRIDDLGLENQMQSPEHSKKPNPGKRKLQSTGSSPQWAEGCGPDEENEPIDKKKKLNYNCTDILKNSKTNPNKIDNKGDGMADKLKNINTSVTPPNVECGQGDCFPSTSSTNPESSCETPNVQLPKLAVECNGYIEFTRTRNSQSAVDTMKWDRKCKVQISYSEDPYNVGEYIIWALRYSDESKCRRNLLAAFEEVASD